MSTAFFVLAGVFVTELITWFGYKQIASLAYGVYANLFKADVLHRQRRIKREIMSVKHELARTSSQDQFAKWAKLRRNMDRKMSELEKITADLGLMRTGFELKFSSGLWIMLNSIQALLMLWHMSTPAFYLPSGWFSPATWFFALPFAPTGSVSVPMWFFLCRKVIRKTVRSTHDSFVLYHKHAPEPIKRQVATFAEWCVAQVRIHMPPTVLWVSGQLRAVWKAIVGASRAKNVAADSAVASVESASSCAAAPT